MRKPGSGFQRNTAPEFGVHPRPHDFPDLWSIAFGPSGEARVGRCGEVADVKSALAYDLLWSNVSTPGNILCLPHQFFNKRKMLIPLFKFGFNQPIKHRK